MRKKTVLFVCRGNTCRSPMAEMIFNYLARAAGIGYCAASAGTEAERGSKLNALAAAALEKAGVPIRRGFASRRLSAIQIGNATLVICMNESTAAEARKLSEKNVLKIRVFGEGIPDPYGCGENVYTETAEKIHFLCKELVDKIKKDEAKD